MSLSKGDTIIIVLKYPDLRRIHSSWRSSVFLLIRRLIELDSCRVGSESLIIVIISIFDVISESDF